MFIQNTNSKVRIQSINYTFSPMSNYTPQAQANAFRGKLVGVSGEARTTILERKPPSTAKNGEMEGEEK